MAAHRYWRLLGITGGASWTLSEMEMRETVDGANTCNAGFGSNIKSSQSANYASNAFNGDIPSEWSPASGGVAGNWIGWDYGAGQTRAITYLRLTNGNDGSTFHMLTGMLQSSDDAVTWTDEIYVATPSPANNEVTNHGPQITATFDITLPALTATAHFGAVMAGALPSLTFSGYCGGNIDAALPALTMTASAGGFIDAAIPALQVYIAGHDATGENAIEVTLPSLQASLHFGANLTAELPALTAAIEAAGVNWGTIDATLPALEGALTGTVSAVASIDARLPALQMVGYFGAVISATIGGVTFEGTGTVGAVASIQVTLPMLEVSIEATTENWGSIDAVLPAITAGNHGAIWALMPGITATLVGTATVEATYEAYALNLNHTGDGPDELTRYTNFPFTHIVRYKNSYFGMSSAGLYLLAGTTDDGTAIDYEVITHKTDFDVPELKTVPSAYFGGRLGAAETVSIIAGETSVNTYAYTTPRGALAQNYRQEFGRGIKARYYAFGLSGSAEFALDTLDVEPLKLKRRI